jgi:Glucosamine-6-phosphate isomerases/6-phosphogluconolactonase
LPCESAVTQHAHQKRPSRNYKKFADSDMPTLYTFKDTDDIAVGLGDFIKKAYDAAIERHNKFTIGLSGGSLPKTLGKALIPQAKDVYDFDKWYLLHLLARRHLD